MKKNFLTEEYPISNVPNEHLWSENFAFFGADASNRIMLYFNFGRWWQAPDIWREIFVVVMPGNQILFAKNYGYNQCDSGVSASLGRLEISERKRSFDLSFRGPVWQRSLDELIERGSSDGPARLCELSLSFQSDLPVWDMHAHHGRETGAAESVAGSMHVEQTGYAHGHLEYQGKRWNLNDVFCNRDHSRGVREIGPYRRHNWIQGGFPNGTGFNLYAMEIFGTEGLAMSKASITRDGKRYPAKISHTEMINGLQDISSRHLIVLESEFGVMEIRVAEVFASFPASVVNPYDVQVGITQNAGGALILEEAVIMEWQGLRGTGISERGMARQPIPFNG